METLVVLTALVCGAIAAPALQEQEFQQFRPTQDIVEEIIPREKKSPAANHGFSDFTETETSQGHNPDFESFAESARSFHSKKPIIVKKKVGYHLYRDSDEEKEQATSRESCKERVKVKLCDENIMPKSTDSMKSTTIEDVGDNIMSEDEMRDSLRMAKEAIANLERDLKRKEQNPTSKSNKKNQDAVDAQIHKDIDTARQVLDHIHRNFGDLDTMSIHRTTSSDADSLHNVQLTIAKTEEERMAQWKEAMLNIKKSTELARNIEDSFRSVSQNINTNGFDPSATANLNENIDSHQVQFDINAKNTELIENNSGKQKQCNSKLHEKKMTKKEVEDNLTADMTGFASTLVESNVDENNDKLLRHANHNLNLEEAGIKKNQLEHIDEEDNQPEQSRNTNSMSGDKKQFDAPGLEQNQINTMRSMENGQDITLNFDKNEKITTNENTFNIDPTSSASQMKSTELNKAKSAAGCMDKKVETSLSPDQIGLNTDDDKTTSIKSAFNVDTSSNTNTDVNDKLQINLPSEQRQPIDVTNTATPIQHTHHSRFNENDAMPGETQHVEHAVLPLDNTGLKHIKEKMGLEDRSTTNNKLDTHQDKEEISMNLKPMQTEMKSADVDTVPTQPSNHAFNTRWPSDQTKNMGHTIQGKGPNEFREDFHNRSPSLNTRFMNGAHMMPSSMKASTHFDASTAQSHMHVSHGNRFHGHVPHGSSSVFDNTVQSTNFNSNMRDATVTFGNDNNMHWKPTQESSRTAYGPMTSGAAAGPSSSAVGLFPNANVGGCSIPLLLSCSPQVTSGSLAKALPAGYASSAYRTEDDFTFFPNKREIKKTDEIGGSTANKMPTIMKQKTKIIADTKQ